MKLAPEQEEKRPAPTTPPPLPSREKVEQMQDFNKKERKDCQVQPHYYSKACGQVCELLGFLPKPTSFLGSEA